MRTGTERQGDGRPQYTVYRARRIGLPRLGSLTPKTLPSRGLRKWAKWIVIACLAWILVSVAAFAISAQLQSSKLDSAAASVLDGGAFMIASPQTILVLGTDARPPGTKEPGAALSPKCYGEQATGAAPSRDCRGHATDTMMLIRAGGGVFRKLSIPRDSHADIPGYPSQKINAAYAAGGAKLTVQTVENFLGIHIDRVVIVDFKGFENFIDAIGDVTVNVPERICSQISGGAANGGVTLNLTRGEHTLNGVEALSYARTRENSCDPRYTDLNREQAQQAVIAGIKGRLTNPLHALHNFLFGPLIGWDAPRAFVSNVGGWTMPQLAISAVLGGTSGGDGLCRPRDSGCNVDGPNYEIIVPQSERRRAVNGLLNG